MLNRRLIVLVIGFIVGFAMLGFRLGKLQLVEADRWQHEMKKALHRNTPIETSRGQLLDRNQIILAHDVVCDDLAIDYRAMNLDDRWLTDAARARLKNRKFADYSERLRTINDTKAAIAERIDTYPDVVSHVCNLPKEEVLQRFQEIRQRIHALQEDFWSRSYDRKNPNATDIEDLDPTSSANRDLAFKKADIKDVGIAHTVVHNLPNDIANYFRQHQDDFPGLIVLDNASTREYGPARDLARPDEKPDPTFAQCVAQVVGTLRSVSSDAIGDTDQFAYKKFLRPDLLNTDTPEDAGGNLSGYLAGDEVGESGAEKAFEKTLHGTRGIRLDQRYQNDASPLPEKRIDPTPGKDVALTIDIALQHDLFNDFLDPSKHLMQDKDGKSHFVTLVILSLDGQVLSMISLPTYDPNNMDAIRGALNADEFHRPLSNRALQGYQPGSTVKPLLSTAALTEKVITPETTITCNGYLFPNRPNSFRCSIYVETNGRATHGPLQLEDAIAQSCNIYFYNVGRLLGVDNLKKWFSLYGLGQDTGFELPEANGILPKINATDDPDAAKVESLFLGIGQGNLTATPLQMANAYATMLRSGLDISPRLALFAPQKRQQRFDLDPAILTTIKEGMRAVVTRGTAKDIFAKFNLPIAGKTGTADTSRYAFDENGKPAFDPDRPLKNEDGTAKIDPTGNPLFARKSATGTDAWFMAYAPYSETEQPKFVVAALMEFGGYGGKAAAPMVKQALLELEKHNYLEPLDTGAAQ